MPLLVAPRRRVAENDDAIAAQSRLTLRGAEVSSIRRVADGALEVRVFNPTAITTTLEVDGAHGTTHDLRGNVTGSFDGTMTLEPWRIATLRLVVPG